LKREKIIIPQIAHPNLILETLPQICRLKDWQFTSIPKVLWDKNEWDTIYCEVQAPKFRSSFELQQMPGCCAVLIACFIKPDPYTHDNFDEVLKVIEMASYEAGFGSLLMAQVVYDDAIWSVCLKRDWIMSDKFVNAKSGNRVVYLTKNLEQKNKRYELEVQV